VYQLRKAGFTDPAAESKGLVGKWKQRPLSWSWI